MTVTVEDVPLVERMYLVLTRMPGDSYRRGCTSGGVFCTLYLHACLARVTVGGVRSLSLCLCDVFPALTDELPCVLILLERSGPRFISDL